MNFNVKSQCWVRTYVYLFEWWRQTNVFCLCVCVFEMCLDQVKQNIIVLVRVRRMPEWDKVFLRPPWASTAGYFCMHGASTYIMKNIYHFILWLMAVLSPAATNENALRGKWRREIPLAALRTHAAARVVLVIFDASFWDLAFLYFWDSNNSFQAWNSAY